MSRTQRNYAFIVLVLGLLIGIVPTYSTSLETLALNTSGLAIGLPFSLAYLFVAWLVMRISPAWPKAGWLWMPLAVLWGGFAVNSFVYLAGSSLSTLMRQLDASAFTASLAGGLPEEVGKALGVFLILAAFQRLNRPWHGFFVGIAVGLGFTVVENLGYGAVGGLYNPDSDAAGVMQMWLTRTQFGAMMHSIYTGIIGWGIAYAMFAAHRSTVWRVFTALVWFLFGFGLHFAWNAAPADMVVQVAKMIGLTVLSYATFLFLYVRSWRWAKKEKAASAAAPGEGGQ